MDCPISKIDYIIVDKDVLVSDPSVTITWLPTSDSPPLYPTLSTKRTPIMEPSSFVKESPVIDPKESVVSNLNSSKDASLDVDIEILEDKTLKQIIPTFTIPLKPVELEVIESMLGKDKGPDQPSVNPKHPSILGKDTQVMEALQDDYVNEEGHVSSEQTLVSSSSKQKSRNTKLVVSKSQM